MVPTLKEIALTNVTVAHAYAQLQPNSRKDLVRATAYNGNLAALSTFVTEESDKEAIIRDALLDAAFGGRTSVVEYVLTRFPGCDFLCGLPIRYAIERGYPDTAIVLLEFHRQKYRRSSGLLHQLENIVEAAIKFDCLQVVTEVVEKGGAFYDQLFDVDECALCVCCRYNRYEIAEYLLRVFPSGADNIFDEASAVYLACRHGHLQLVRLLMRGCLGSRKELQKGLEVACVYGMVDVVTMILDEFKKEVDVRYDNDVLLRIACREGYHDIAKLLLDIGCDVHSNYNEPLRAAASLDPNMVRLLMDRGADAFAYVPTGDYVSAQSYDEGEPHMNAVMRATASGRSDSGHRLDKKNGGV